MRPNRTLRVAALMAVGAAATLTGVLTGGPPVGADVPSLPAPSSHGISTTAFTEVTANQPTNQARLFDATVTTSAIYRPGTGATTGTFPIKVRILLPANYSTDPAKAYDVLYLLHGGSDSYVDWSTDGAVKDIVSGSPFKGIVVMPEAGMSGWYTDWYGETDGHFSPQWETFHNDQLVPWIDANFNTKANRAGRALAGVSMGGWGALHYAAEHSDLYGKLGLFSAGTDITEPGAQKIIADSMWEAGAATTANFFDGKTRVNLYNNGWYDWDQNHQFAYRLQTVLGPPSTWSSINPVDVASAGGYNSFDGRLAMYAGGNPSGETGIGQVNNDLHNRLNARGVTHRYCTGTGDHDWQWFREDFRDFLNVAYGTAGACPNGWTLRP